MERLEVQRLRASSFALVQHLANRVNWPVSLEGQPVFRQVYLGWLVPGLACRGMERWGCRPGNMGLRGLERDSVDKSSVGTEQH